MSFPPKVEAALREGRAVEPETFRDTTVFFRYFFLFYSQQLSAEEVISI